MKYIYLKKEKNTQKGKHTHAHLYLEKKNRTFSSQSSVLLPPLSYSMTCAPHCQHFFIFNLGRFSSRSLFLRSTTPTSVCAIAQQSSPCPPQPTTMPRLRVERTTTIANLSTSSSSFPTSALGVSPLIHTAINSVHVRLLHSPSQTLALSPTRTTLPAT